MNKVFEETYKLILNSELEFNRKDVDYLLDLFNKNNILPSYFGLGGEDELVFVFNDDNYYKLISYYTSGEIVFLLREKTSNVRKVWDLTIDNIKEHLDKYL